MNLEPKKDALSEPSEELAKEVIALQGFVRDFSEWQVGMDNRITTLEKLQSKSKGMVLKSKEKLESQNAERAHIQDINQSFLKNASKARRQPSPPNSYQSPRRSRRQSGTNPDQIKFQAKSSKGIPGLNLATTARRD